MKHALVFFLAVLFAPIAQSASSTSLLQQIEAEQVAVIERARGYVVSISVTQISDGKGKLLSGKEGSGGLGSGVIVSRDGKIITNKHVVDGKDLVRKTGKKAELIYSYKVTLSNKKVYDAELVQAPGDIDLALLKIKNPPPGLEPAVLADTSLLRAGQIVFAIGSPFGFKDSVSMGVVSNVDRIDEEMSKLHSFIQTDAAINPGNSGGALVNVSAEVIGINTMIYSESGGNNGLGFAIPAKVVREFLTGAQSVPKVTGWIGIVVDGIDAQTRMMFSIDKSISGLWVTTIDQKSPGVGKILPGDIIVALDGEALTRPEDWKRIISLKGEGTKVTLSIVRKGKPIEVSVVLGKVPTP